LGGKEGLRFSTHQKQKGVGKKYAVERQHHLYSFSQRKEKTFGQGGGEKEGVSHSSSRRRGFGGGKERGRKKGGRKKGKLFCCNLRRSREVFRMAKMGQLACVISRKIVKKRKKKRKRRPT